jgi:hypothetical protein
MVIFVNFFFTGKWIVISLERNCEESPFMLDGVEGENHVMTYYRSCRAHLCNFGDGVTSLKDVFENEIDEPEEIEEDPLNSASNSFFVKLHFFAFIFIFSIT